MIHLRRALGGPERRRGQSLTEFAVVIPVMLVLVIEIGDFGRLFATGVTLESLTRDAAEGGSSRYVSTPPGPLNSPAPAPAPGYYDAIHLYASRAVCAAARGLPGVTFDPSTATCPGMPYVLVCVHDGQDPLCSTEANAASPPADCVSFQPGTMPTNAQADGSRRYVEVRTCYRFDSVLAVPLYSFGTIWIERTRTFDIPCYFTLGPADCG